MTERTHRAKPDGSNLRNSRSAERRSAIVQAALAEFSEKGFAAARMEDVARRAGVAKGTLYLYFRDKQALFVGLIRDAIGPLVDQLTGNEPADGESVRSFLGRIAPEMAARLVAPPSADVVRLLIAEGGRFPELATAYYEEVVARGLPRIRALALRASQDGDGSTDAMARYPQLMIAPALMAVIWTGLFGNREPLDVEGLMRAQIELLLARRP